MKIFCKAFLASFLFWAPSHAQYTYQYLGGSCQKGNMAFSHESFSCNSGDQCSEGDTVNAEGAITLYGNDQFPSNYQVTIKPCMYFLYLWYICDEGGTNQIDICQSANMQSDNYQCPSPGTYTFDFSWTAGDYFDESFGTSIFMEAQIEDLDQVASGGGQDEDDSWDSWWYEEESDEVSYEIYEKCTFQFEPVESYSYSWQFAGAAALLSMTGALIFRQKRRRQAVLGSLEEDVSENNNKAAKPENASTDFVEMVDFTNTSAASVNGAVI